MIDQLISIQLGLIPQSSSYLTVSRIWVCQIFLDLYTGYGYGFMLKNTLLKQTIEGKRAFEKELSKHSIKIAEYQANNGCFAEKGFSDKVEACN